MCDVCTSEGIDWSFANGSKHTKLTTAKFHNVYIGRVAQVKLCRIHDIQLFSLGEVRFLAAHISLAKTLVSKRSDFM